MPKTVCQSVAWFKRYKTLKSVTVGRSVAQLEKILIFSEKLARPSASLVINYLPTYLLQFYPENLKIIINLEMIVYKDIA